MMTSQKVWELLMFVGVYCVIVRIMASIMNGVEALINEYKRRRDARREFSFMTSHSQKHEVVSKIMKGVASISMVRSDGVEDMDTPVKVAMSKLKGTKNKMVEECSLSVRGVRNMPGMSMRSILKQESEVRTFCEQFAGEEAVVTVVAACSTASSEIVTAVGTSRVKILPMKNWDLVRQWGWDAILSPAVLRVPRPIYSLSNEERSMMDVRSSAWFKLRWRLSSSFQTDGAIFEVHMTMSRGSDLSKFVDICQVRNLSHHIFNLVDRTGKEYQQLQTGRFVQGNMEMVNHAIMDDGIHLTAAGFKIARIRIEYIVSQPEATIGDGQYFEFHKRVIPCRGIQWLRFILSFNKDNIQIAQSAKDPTKVFLNWRCYERIRLDEATARFDKIVRDLVSKKSIKEVDGRKRPVREVCIYDSVPDLDLMDLRTQQRLS